MSRFWRNIFTSPPNFSLSSLSSASICPRIDSSKNCRLLVKYSLLLSASRPVNHLPTSGPKPSNLVMKRSFHLLSGRGRHLASAQRAADDCAQQVQPSAVRWTRASAATAEEIPLGLGGREGGCALVRILRLAASA